MSLKERILDHALKLGFELCGLVPAYPVPDFDAFRSWLDQGYAGTMTYLGRGAEKRANPDRILPGVKTLICVGMNYHQSDPHPQIAQYALGRDYHDVMGAKLRLLEDFLRALDPTAKTKSYVDTGAILERGYAARAGLGWIGKNTCLINDGVGSFFFIGEILTTQEFPAEDYGLPALDQCGTCTKCLDACPTEAFVAPYVMDARRCISYLTIEYRGDFSEEQAAMVGGHVYGCDICQTVCPYNDRISGTREPGFQARPEIRSLTLERMRTLSEDEFAALTRGNAMDRVKFLDWKRNVEAVKNSQPARDRR